MIKGVGIDMVQISRIKQSLQIPGFKESVFTLDEIKNCHEEQETYYATRFAGKEAVYKALNHDIDMRKIEILNRNDGALMLWELIKHMCQLQQRGILQQLFVY